MQLIASKHLGVSHLVDLLLYRTSFEKDGAVPSLLLLAVISLEQCLVLYLAFY